MSEWTDKGWREAGAPNADEPEAFHRGHRVVDHVVVHRLTPDQDALNQLAEDLRRAGFSIAGSELVQLLYPPARGVPVTIAAQEYLALPREDGQPGLRLVHRLGDKPEREHR